MPNFKAQEVDEIENGVQELAQWLQEGNKSRGAADDGARGDPDVSDASGQAADGRKTTHAEELYPTGGCSTNCRYIQRMRHVTLCMYRSRADRYTAWLVGRASVQAPHESEQSQMGGCQSNKRERTGFRHYYLFDAAFQLNLGEQTRRYVEAK